MLPQANENSSKNDAFAFRLEMLNKELDYIHSSIRKIDDIGNSIKNWAIVAWTGYIAVILGKPEIYKYIIFSAVPPLLFMMLDAHWRKLQRRFMYRQRLISDFLNSAELDEAFQTRKFNFHLLDPFARKYTKNKDLKEYISIRKILSFPTVSLIYISLAVLSLIISTIFYFIPPNLQNTNLPAKLPAPTAPAPIQINP